MNILSLTGREPYPVLPLLRPEDEAAQPEKAKEYYELRREAIVLAQRDPLHYGYEPEIWRVADKHRLELRAKFPKGVIREIDLGGNRSSKSERAAKRVVEALIANPGSRWWCCDSTEAQSRINGQALIFKYLPPQWRPDRTGRLPKTKTTKLTYSDGSGFSENWFILPNGSGCWFKFYEMNIHNLEGPELDGVWADELIPMDWIETLVYRLVNRNGILHITFTPKKGYTPTVGHYLDDSKVVEETEAPLLPIKDASGKIIGGKKVPRIRFCRDEKARVIYFHTSDNPFGNYEGMIEEVRYKGEAEIAMRVYGDVSKAAYVQFPTFKDTVHVIPMNRFKAIEQEFTGGARFHMVDPCSGRNWFMLWIYFWKPHHGVIYREWPSYGHNDAYIPGIGDPGEWALAGEPHDGDRGPAQDPFGLGLVRYKEEILRIEGGEEITERWIDARYSNTPKTEREGTTTLIEQMAELEMNFVAATSEKNIIGANDGSIDLINSALEYDNTLRLGEFSPRLARINEPRLLITENCPNTIHAFQNWTGKDGTQGACKDPIDCVRMVYLSDLDFVSEDMLTPRNDWQKQFVAR